MGAIREFRVQGFRAFKDSGLVRVASNSAFIGKNDAGKSALLGALKLFFSPPKKGGVLESDIHFGVKEVVVEVALDPAGLSSTKVKIDAKNLVDILMDKLVDQNGLLRMRVTWNKSGLEGCELNVVDFATSAGVPLALCTQEQLLEEMGKLGLPQVKAGKQTNAEKRELIRKAAKAAGATEMNGWYDAGAVEAAIREVFPQFVYFTDTANYGIDETPVQTAFKGSVEAGIGGLPEAAKLEGEIASLVQAEFDQIATRLSALTDTVSGLTAAPSISWKKAIDSIDLLWRDASGIEVPFGNRGAGVRRLFMVAYFQYVAARDLIGAGTKRYVFAIEEPEVHLHPGAQSVLLEAFQELASRGHDVVITTHSPVFASAVPIDGLALVTRKSAASSVTQVPAMSLEEVASELGVDVSHRLVGRNYVVLVEGKRDQLFYEVVLEELYQVGLVKLDPSKVLFVQVGGIGNMKFAVASASMERAGLKWAVLVDSDRTVAGGPIHVNAAAILKTHPKSCLAVEVLERTFIENYLDPAAVKAETGIDCLIPDYGKAKDSSGAPLGEKEWEKVKDSCSGVARRMGGAGLAARAPKVAGTSEWVVRFENIRVAFGL